MPRRRGSRLSASPAARRSRSSSLNLSERNRIPASSRRENPQLGAASPG
jgi:hypothetical protein